MGSLARERAACIVSFAGFEIFMVATIVLIVALAVTRIEPVMILIAGSWPWL